MNLSPLQLTHYHLRGISVYSRDMPDGSAERAELYPSMVSGDVVIEVVLNLPPDEEDPKQFMIGLVISSPEALREDFPYTFGAHIEGMFHIKDDGDLERRKQLVVINGASMLFGILREQMLALTMRQLNGPMMLPSLDFRGLSPAKEAPKKKTPKTQRKTTPRVK